MIVQIRASSRQLPDDLFTALYQQKSVIKLTIDGVEFPLSITESEVNVLVFGVYEVISTFQATYPE